jgi:hypothetical protein
MKTRIINLVVLLSLFTILTFVFSSCSKSDTDKPSLPSELLGSWAKSFGGGTGCTQTWTFRSNDYTYAESCYYTGYNSYDDSVDEVYLDENMFRTPDDTYIAWHIDGSKLYLYETNPGASKPALGANWWTGYSAYNKQ